MSLFFRMEISTNKVIIICGLVALLNMGCMSSPVPKQIGNDFHETGPAMISMEDDGEDLSQLQERKKRGVFDDLLMNLVLLPVTIPVNLISTAADGPAIYYGDGKIKSHYPKTSTTRE